MPLTTWILSRHWHVSPLGFVPQKPPGHFPSLLYFHLPSCMSLPFRIFSQVLTKEAHPHTSVLSPPFMCHYEYIISWVTGTQTSLGEKKEIIAQWLSKGESEKKKNCKAQDITLQSCSDGGMALTLHSFKIHLSHHCLRPCGFKSLGALRWVLPS